MQEKNNLAAAAPMGLAPAKLFENPLYEDFIHLDDLAKFFRKSEKWVMVHVAEGRLHAYPVGKGEFLFSIPEVREAILAGLLAPKAKEIKNDDKEKKNQGRQAPIPRQREGQRVPSIFDL